ncbi:hypothetical protein [Paraburkholderia phenoliruptrix]|uniref:hypothetical protein n=1 Tax=Paraburkholderia phenoliruptrix TaxID=252970 RepID=UPI00286A5367|nr:hypothetical protein [Paraburkholderia phenoliruptrix]
MADTTVVPSTSNIDHGGVVQHPIGMIGNTIVSGNGASIATVTMTPLALTTVRPQCP